MQMNSISYLFIIINYLMIKSMIIINVAPEGRNVRVFPVTIRAVEFHESRVMFDGNMVI